MSGELIRAFRSTLAKIAEIEARIEADQQELTALRGEIKELRGLIRADYVEAEATRATDAPVAKARKRPIHDKSTVGNARRVLQMAGGPLHVDEIIANIEHMTGLPVNKSTLVSNLSRYVKKGDTFRRAGANVFALVKYEDPTSMFSREEIRKAG
jgi:hypothetical protein